MSEVTIRSGGKAFWFERTVGVGRTGWVETGTHAQSDGSRRLQGARSRPSFADESQPTVRVSARWAGSCPCRNHDRFRFPSTHRPRVRPVRFRRPATAVGISFVRTVTKREPAMLPAVPSVPVQGRAHTEPVRRGYLVAVECLGAPKWSGRKCSTGRNRSSGSLRPNSRQASLSQQPLRHGLAGALSRSLLSFHTPSLGVNSCSPLRSLF